VINRSESQLIAREQLNQVLKSPRPVTGVKPVRTEKPRRKNLTS